ncbi:glucose-1-phosphate thymidylyltransferase [Thalassobacillus devorans]|uniref:Glucose-1-phosphate thymidylyltransferase n=1 Tax=Thalassobacillus devorans TaxID=279813 RepID=A0ABQ1P036_9BACI|nr:glucose-1-phosphate thymidylyltransferase [Thalassobacillus devorans]NIK28145.1 glucose-1-phosphate thymidylyltransferase [Thalassobacillus devorans]GGC88537.1 glucose-1-phosphate thymidylyltransferase [Thalassobacillus devorans]
MKGLILTAGNGTRLRPLSYTKPKPLLPVSNRPVISYGIEQLAEMGIKDIGLVIQPHQEDTFHEHLYAYAVKKKMRLHYIPQYEQKGIAHAVAQAEDFLGSDSFVLLLGDNLIDDSLQKLKESFEQTSAHGTVLVTEVSKPQDYGIADIKDDKLIEVEEKPEKPKSNLAVIGAYIFKSSIFNAIHSISPSARGEYEITDAIQWMIDHHYHINYVKTAKPTFDVGTIDRWLKANQWMLKRFGNSTDADFLDENSHNAVIIPPVVIGDNCTIEDSVIGPYVSIQSDVIIKKSIVKNSIILKGCHIENMPYEISDSILGEKTKLSGNYVNDNTIQAVFGDESTFFLSCKDKSKDKGAD